VTLQACSLGGLVRKVDTSGPDVRSGMFTYVDLSSIDAETKSIDQPKLIALAEAPSRARQRVEKDDVLVSTVRPNLNGVAQVSAALDQSIASTGFCVLRPNPEQLDARYLFNWVRSPVFVEEMTRLATGASYPAVSDSIIKASFIPLPDLPEQRRIAEILDRADELRVKRRRSLALLDEFADAAFEEMIGTELRAPQAGKIVALGELLSQIDSGDSPVCLDRPARADEWAVLKLSAISMGVFKPALNNKALAEGYAPRPHLEVKTGDVLVARKNTPELVGVSAFVRDTPPKMLLPDLIFRLVLRADALVRPEFLQRQLSRPAQRRALRRLASGSAASMSNISKERLKSLPIFVPPLELQNEYCDLIDKVESQRSSALVHLRNLEELFSSLQHRAFSGQLRSVVDPADDDR